MTQRSLASTRSAAERCVISISVKEGVGLETNALFYDGFYAVVGGAPNVPGTPQTDQGKPTFIYGVPGTLGTMLTMQLTQ